jgi:hypothetical protein
MTLREATIRDMATRRLTAVQIECPVHGTHLFEPDWTEPIDEFRRAHVDCRPRPAARPKTRRRE